MSRGWIIFTVIIVIAAAGFGWWYVTSGPGADDEVTIEVEGGEDVTELEPEEAEPVEVAIIAPTPTESVQTALRYEIPPNWVSFPDTNWLYYGDNEGAEWWFYVEYDAKGGHIKASNRATPEEALDPVSNIPTEFKFEIPPFWITFPENPWRIDCSVQGYEWWFYILNIDQSDRIMGSQKPTDGEIQAFCRPNGTG